MRTHFLFREVNLRIHELTAADGPFPEWGGVVEYVCECAALDCHGYAPLERSKFAEIAATPDLYVVAPGHYPAGADIVEREVKYAVVRIATEVTAPERLP